MTGKSNFIANVVGLVNSRNQNMNIYIHIVAFYPKDLVKDKVNESKVKLIKVVASDICILNLDEEDLPRSSLSVILIDTASGNPEIGIDKVTLDLNAREYIDNQNNSSLLFNLYHFPEDSHLLSITTKISRSTLLYVSDYLSIIEDLFLIRMIQINFIESLYSTTHKSSNYAWEKR
ncbi:877_t:CDS:2 [Funneliformis geosporum]|uniref:877_t:CDS:1 n=1 Tax=Funneliformis geosporum TaxID=1117311 RepID=A0A9W4WIB9_9GLOM|nr:877_t:CDS:2 [Funneliformis geosporum]